MAGSDDRGAQREREGESRGGRGLLAPPGGYITGPRERSHVLPLPPRTSPSPAIVGAAALRAGPRLPPGVVDRDAVQLRLRLVVVAAGGGGHPVDAAAGGARPAWRDLRAAFGGVDRPAAGAARLRADPVEAGVLAPSLDQRRRRGLRWQSEEKREGKGREASVGTAQVSLLPMRRRQDASP